MSTLKDKTLFITGASRGIGEAIALGCAKDGANIVITGKTDATHPKLPGTIYSVAKAVEKAGGRALALKLDVRDEKATYQAMQKAATHFGGIDILVNNASAISLSKLNETCAKHYDLMQSVNTRATFFATQAAVEFLKEADNPHILTLSPPLNLDPKWFSGHLAYTLSKYGMSMCTLGFAEGLKKWGIASNALWPKTTIATAAIEYNFPKKLMMASRKPSIMADAAKIIFSQNSREYTGKFLVDEDVLRGAGINDFDQYAMMPGMTLYPDLFL